MGGPAAHRRSQRPGQSQGGAGQACTETGLWATTGTGLGAPQHGGNALVLGVLEPQQLVQPVTSTLAESTAPITR